MTRRPELTALQAERSRACRLTPDAALADVAEAAAWVHERGIVTITPDCSLPSLFLACQEPPYRPGSRGFGLWPRTKYPWAVELTAHPGIHALKIHRGKRVLVSGALAVKLDPLCRAAVQAFVRPHDVKLTRADGEGGAEAAAPEVSVARVERLAWLGGYVKLSLKLSDGAPMTVEMPRAEIEALGIGEGDLVMADLKQARVFVEDYSI